MTTTPAPTAPTTTPVQVAESFLDALVHQDFDRLAACLADDAHMRALLPPGNFEWTGSREIADNLAFWFGDAEEIEVLHATVDEIGGRLHLRWRLRVSSCPRGPGWHVIEQQAFADATDRIESLDLLCSGFHPEDEAEQSTNQAPGGRS